MPTIPLSEAKTHLARILTQVETLGEQVLITRSGRPAGVLLPVDEYEGLIETLEILADSELAAAVRQGLDDLERGDTLSHHEVWDELDGTLHP